jgi:hypothetical protein
MRWLGLPYMVFSIFIYTSYEEMVDVVTPSESAGIILFFADRPNAQTYFRNRQFETGAKTEVTLIGPQPHYLNYRDPHIKQETNSYEYI